MWFATEKGHFVTHTCEWVTSHTHVNESQHTHVWTSHVTHVWMSNVTHAWMSHVPHVNESRHISEWVKSDVWMRHEHFVRVRGKMFVTQTQNVRTSYIGMSHVRRVNASRTFCSCLWENVRDANTKCSYVISRNESCQTCECVTSHV